VKDLRQYGQPVERSWRLAVATVGQVQWEPIEPLDDEGISTRVSSPRRVTVSTPRPRCSELRRDVAAQAERGNAVILSGEFSGVRVAYLAPTATSA